MRVCASEQHVTRTNSVIPRACAFISQSIAWLSSFDILVPGIFKNEHAPCLLTGNSFLQTPCRHQVEEMFYHAYDGYKRFAFPQDELKPLSCSGSNPYGGMAMTLMESLGTLLLLGNVSEFNWGVEYLSQHLSFDLDIRVCVPYSPIPLPPLAVLCFPPLLSPPLPFNPS
ncbi:unnamed protein product [Closterium sp. NIES-54]